MNYYDPWGHAVRIFINRVLLFIFLTALLGLGAWAAVLYLCFDADKMQIGRSTAGLLWSWSAAEMTWRVIFVQCMVIGALLTACLYLWLRGRPRLRRGDRHHRGTRVVRHHDDDRDADHGEQ